MTRSEQQTIALSTMQNIVQIAADAVLLALGDITIQQLEASMTANVREDVSRAQDQSLVVDMLCERACQRDPKLEDLAVVGLTTINTHVIAGQTSLR